MANDVYMYRAAFLCSHCAGQVMEDLDRRGMKPADIADEASFDSDDYPKGPYPNGGGEADTPQHCDHCDAFLDNPLTSDGEEYVRDAMEDDSSDAAVLAEWREAYGYLFDD